MIRDWISELGPDEPLFAKLAGRKTWLMVKKDLERAGIPYKTNDGIADFQAAGRHTHITELLRNGAKLAATKELARHGDIRMTMRYTHIGIEDQAKALNALPVPGESSGTCQDIVRKPADSDGRSTSSAGASRHDEDAGQEDETPCEVTLSDSSRHKKAPPDPDGAKWRRPRGLATGLT